MLMTNEDIYTYARRIDEQFNNTVNDLKLPVRINFYLQKNIKAVMGPAQEIEEARLNIAKEYGEPDEDKQSYRIPPEKFDIVNKELDDLLALQQEIQIYPLKLSDFDGIDLTYAQVDALSFMIQED